jgi:glutamyl-tRNA reductase
MTFALASENKFAAVKENMNRHFALPHFIVAGINYRKSDVDIRSKFSINPTQAEEVLANSKLSGMPGCIVISTCNRTEIYAIAQRASEVVDLLINHTQGTAEEFHQFGYIHEGAKAIEHIFRVAAGLDSQIKGDYEILSQIKLAAKQSKQHGCINGFMERLLNFVLHASKRIKTETKLSAGTVSVSYAAIEILRANCQIVSGKKVLLVGTGKLGKHVARNLKTYFPGSKLSFANRTNEKAFLLADECDAQYVPYEKLSVAADKADIIIVSSAADDYTIIPSFFSTNRKRLILDLSVPRNVDPSVSQVPGVDLLNVDEISAVLEETIRMRENEVPKALKIIEETMNEMNSWYQQQAYNPLLRTVKSQLMSLTPSEDSIMIQKTVSNLAIALRRQDNKGCQCIHALNSYLHLHHEKNA